MTDDEVDIKPDSFGAVYLSHSGYRRRLNEAFRPGGWALRRLTPYTFDNEQHIAYAEFALYAEGRFVGMATGEMRLAQNNEDMSTGDIIEGLKSNALMRCCKDLGMAMECWDLKWTQSFRQRLCVRVWVKKGRNADAKPQWRRLDAPPFFGETGIVDDSPNKDKYRKGGVEEKPSVAMQVFEKVSEGSRTAVEKAFELLGLSPGVRMAKLNECFTQQTDPEESVNALLLWCKQEYAKRKGTTYTGPKPDGNGKPAPQAATTHQPAPASGSEGAGASDVRPAPAEVVGSRVPTDPPPMEARDSAWLTKDKPKDAPAGTLGF